MGRVEQGVLIVWLLLLIVLTILRVPAWQSSATLWAAARQEPPVSRRTWGQLQRWDMILWLDEQPAQRQPFSTQERPR